MFIYPNDFAIFLSIIAHISKFFILKLKPICNLTIFSENGDANRNNHAKLIHI